MKVPHCSSAQQCVNYSSSYSDLQQLGRRQGVGEERGSDRVNFMKWSQSENRRRNVYLWSKHTGLILKAIVTSGQFFSASPGEALCLWRGTVWLPHCDPYACTCPRAAVGNVLPTRPIINSQQNCY